MAAASFQADPQVVQVAEAFALDAVDLAARNFRITLDWSEASIQQVERMLGKLHDQMGSARPSEETVWVFAKSLGSYIGEVLRRRHGAAWGMVTLDGQSYPGLQLPGGGLVWPWAKAHKRMTNGPEDNVWHYYRILLANPGDAGAAANAPAQPATAPASVTKKAWWKFW
jgi:hypothetical protein